MKCQALGQLVGERFGGQRCSPNHTSREAPCAVSSDRAALIPTPSLGPEVTSMLLLLSLKINDFVHAELKALLIDGEPTPREVEQWDYLGN